MRRLLVLCGIPIWVAAAWAQSSPATGPELAVDAASARHPISPDIYGVNEYEADGASNLFAADAVPASLRIAVRRFGGDATSRYNWTFDNYNSGGDYYFENFPYDDPDNGSHLPDGSYFDRFLEQNLRTGTKTMATIPMMGWTTKSRDRACSFSVQKYGPQQSVDPYSPDCGNGHPPNQPNNWLTDTDPHDTSAEADESFYQNWIKHLIARYGPANQGGVAIWSLDNEPEWWMSVHHDIHPAAASYDEMTSLGIRFAQAIKAADPTALVSGPVPAGWTGYFYSALDFVSGWSTGPNYVYNGNPVDRNAHGGTAWLDYYLEQMQAYDHQHGRRLLDYLDVHAYVAPDGISFGAAGDAATQQLRLTSTRAFWDPNYAEAVTDNQAPRLIPRLHDWVNNNYPGTKTAITEYNWGALDDITGALAEADILGIFGRESLDMATLWGPPKSTDPGRFAFGIFRNYDGHGSQFGDTSVSATTGNPDQLSIFASQRSDQSLIVVAINKTTGDLSSFISLANFASSGMAHVFQYSPANLSAIVNQPDLQVTASGWNGTFPAYSITLFEIPAAASAFQAPKPAIAAVVNAASYAKVVAPGEMVTIFGTDLGPAGIQYLALDSNGLLANSIAGVRVLFDGVPAPILYAQAGQCAAVVPYITATRPEVNVQIEYQGRRSDSFPVAVSTAGPGIFTLNAQGTGQAAAINPDGKTSNSTLSPAAPGSIVSLYLTGEGQTNPPGLDGKIATTILPAPVLPVSVKIGGLDAAVKYAGAAPLNTAGLMQVNVEIPAGIVPGDATPVTLTIGPAASRTATLAIR